MIWVAIATIYSVVDAGGWWLRYLNVRTDEACAYRSRHVNETTAVLHLKTDRVVTLCYYLLEPIKARDFLAGRGFCTGGKK